MAMTTMVDEAATTRLYSMRELERDFGVNRYRLGGLVEGLGYTTYPGPRGAICLDTRGREMLRRHLTKRGYFRRRSKVPA